GDCLARSPEYGRRTSEPLEHRDLPVVAARLADLRGRPLEKTHCLRRVAAVERDRGEQGEREARHQPVPEPARHLEALLEQLASARRVAEVVVGNRELVEHMRDGPGVAGTALEGERLLAPDDGLAVIAGVER